MAGKNWTRMSRGTSVGMLHALLGRMPDSSLGPRMRGQCEEVKCWNIFILICRRQPFDPREIRDGGGDVQRRILEH
eukprot:5307714-Pyramimonas_sp.AAC.1